MFDCNAPELERSSLGVFDGSVHCAEKRPTILHQAMKMDLVQEITLGFTEIISVIPVQRCEKRGNFKRMKRVELLVNSGQLLKHTLVFSV